MNNQEIDRQIAEKVFGMKAYTQKRGEYTHVTWHEKGKEPWIGSRGDKSENYSVILSADIDPMKHVEHGPKEYSTNIAHAFEVRDKIMQISPPDRLRFIAELTQIIRIRLRKQIPGSLIMLHVNALDISLAALRAIKER